MADKSMLVVGSHAIDYALRAGGTIAAYVREGWAVKIVDLTTGERGESCGFWETSPGITEEEIKAIRKGEALRAAEILGADIEFLDWGDHPLEGDRDKVLQLARIMKEFRPRIILTQFQQDQLNPDHPATAEAVFQAVRLARVAGVFPELPRITMPDIYLFDTNAPEYMNFKPNVFIDITEHIDQKMQAIAVSGSSKKEYMLNLYRARAAYRATNARMFSGDKTICYAEAFMRFAPYVGKQFG